MLLRVKENCRHPNKLKKGKEKSNLELGKAQEKTVQRKLMIRSRRSTTSLWHPELEGAFSAGTKGVSITAGILTTSLFLFGGACERSTPFPLSPYEFTIFRTTEILFAHCYRKTCYKSFAIPIAYTGYDGCSSHHRFPQAKLIFPLDLPKKTSTPFLFTMKLPGILTLFSHSFSTFLADVSSSSFSPRPETSRRILPWLFRL